MNIRATTSYTVTQNFLKKSVIEKVFPKYIKIEKEKLLVDIGAGTGNITSWLYDNSTSRIIAFEIDPILQSELTSKYQATRVKVFGNFLTQKVGEPYQVVANIPFMSTTEIIDRLTRDIFFTTGYIIMQKEAAERFAGSQIKGNASTLKSVLLQNSFTIEILHQFDKNDFEPKPGIDTVLIKLERKLIPNYSQRRWNDFENFVTYLFQHSHPILRRAPTVGRYVARKIRFEDIPILQKKPSEVSFEEYVKIFEVCELDLFFKLSDAKRDLKALQDDLEKNHRTRNSDDWKKEGGSRDNDKRDSNRRDSKFSGRKSFKDRDNSNSRSDRKPRRSLKNKGESDSRSDRKPRRNFKRRNNKSDSKSYRRPKRDEKRTDAKEENKPKRRGYKKTSKRGMSTSEKRRERNKYKSSKYSPRRRKSSRVSSKNNR